MVVDVKTVVVDAADVFVEAADETVEAADVTVVVFVAVVDGMAKDDVDGISLGSIVLLTVEMPDVGFVSILLPLDFGDLKIP